MSIEYTAEDFAQANLATKGEFGVARRTDPRDTRQWNAYDGGYGWFSDEEMARDGWEPVVESEAHDRVVTLLDTKKTHERTICELRHDLAVARKERERLAHDLRRSYGHPKGGNAITLDGLEAAWEAAEEADECRKGDVLIRQDDYEVYGDSAGYAVYPATADGPLTFARILSRAPKREPWADLADVLTDYDGSPDPAHAAPWLHERGVRVTGGDEK